MTSSPAPCPLLQPFPLSRSPKARHRQDQGLDPEFELLASSFGNGMCALLRLQAHKPPGKWQNVSIKFPSTPTIEGVIPRNFCLPQVSHICLNHRETISQEVSCIRGNESTSYKSVVRIFNELLHGTWVFTLESFEVRLEMLKRLCFCPENNFFT